VQLPGGSNSIKAAYAGDNSFNASSATSAITITPAGTTISAPGVVSGNGAAVGQTVELQVNVNTSSSGAGPTGTVTFYANGTALNGTATFVGNPGQGPGSSAYGIGTLFSDSNAFPTPGSYTLTAKYSGDTNYGGSTSTGNTIAVKYVSPTMSLNPLQQSVIAGASATLTTLVDTTNKTVYPTGTVTFSNIQTGATLAGPVACTSTTDSSGNYACQASGTFTVTNSVTVLAKYSGDTNYPVSNSNYASIDVPNFSIGQQGPVTVTQGQSQNLTLYINPSGGFTGVVTFSCSGLPVETTCSFNPAQITTQGSTTLTISTTPLGQFRRRLARAWTAASEAGFLLGICIMVLPMRRRRRGVVIGIMIMLLVLPGCGGGGGGGGGGNTSNPVPSVSSLSPTSLAAGSAAHTLVISGTGFNGSSTVTYNGVAHTVTSATATQLYTAVSASDISATGSFPVVVTNPAPGGGSSGPVNFDVVTGTPTGTFNVTVTGTSGSLTNSIAFPLTVQ
jgi:hypothetical protein